MSPAPGTLASRQRGAPLLAARCALRPARPRLALLRCRAEQRQQQDNKQRARLNGQPSRQRGSSSGGSSSGGSSSSSDPGSEGWRPFDPAAYDRPWSVPWGGAAVAGTMAAWAGSFVVTAFLAAPAAYVAATRTPLWELGPAGQADFAFWSEVMELAVTMGLLWAVTRKHDASELREQRLFDFSPAAPLRPPDGWLAWALLGAGAAPLVVGAAAALLSAVGYDQAVAGGRGTAEGVAGMLTLDAGTYVRLIATTGVMAPVLEESLFRGFLLTSLTKFMPVPAAVLASSAAFGVAHLSIRDLPILITLGCLLGALYVRSRNLLTPILVHGAWNSTVLTLLFALTAAGVDVQQLLRDGTM